MSQRVAGPETADASGANPARAVLDPHTAARRSELARRLVGHKVILSTRDFHYAVGQLVAIDDQDRLHLSVAGQNVLVPRVALATLREAEPALAEYVK